MNASIEDTEQQTLESKVPARGPDKSKAQASARQGLNELVLWALENQYSDTAGTIRALLLSLYNSQPCDLAAVQFLDTCRRRWLVALILGIGRDGGVWDYEIREAFVIAGGEKALRWFMQPTGGIDDDLVRHFISAVERKVVAA